MNKQYNIFLHTTYIYAGICNYIHIQYLYIYIHMSPLLLPIAYYLLLIITLTQHFLISCNQYPCNPGLKLSNHTNCACSRNGSLQVETHLGRAWKQKVQAGKSVGDQYVSPTAMTAYIISCTYIGLHTMPCGPCPRTVRPPSGPNGLGGPKPHHVCWSEFDDNPTQTR